MVLLATDPRDDVGSRNGCSNRRQLSELYLDFLPWNDAAPHRLCIGRFALGYSRESWYIEREVSGKKKKERTKGGRMGLYTFPVRHGPEQEPNFKLRGVVPVVRDVESQVSEAMCACDVGR